ncbi:MAG: alpha/beta fold hydrolase [Akkermansiaceae bacterium]
MNQEKLLLLLLSLFVPWLTRCSTTIAVPDTIRLEKSALHSFDGDQLPYTKWLPKDEPEIVIIGVHGISGAAADYRPLATHLLANQTRIAVYAAETRGQGNDPIKERRGHVRKREDWYRDLYGFTALIRKKHPAAKIVWCGESMGSLIVLHAYARQAAEIKAKPPCDAIILSSPITEIKGDFPRWKIYAAHSLATIFPKARISLETLSGQDEVKVTKNSVHQRQVENNPYHIKRHTLRLLSTLGDMIETSHSAGQMVNLPMLILHGGQDIFSETKAVERFSKSLPNQKNITLKLYPESYHLLFHDHQSDEVINDIESWLKTLNK